MVKLIAARAHRLYGPRGSQDWFELLNSIVFLVGTVLLLAGLILLLANFSHPLKYKKAHTGLIFLSIAVCVIILVNLHDLGAHVGGIDFRLDLLGYDPQLALVEIGAPLVYIIGGVLYLIALIFLLKSKSLVVGGRERAALELLIAGSVCWVLGSLHNACQVYNRSSATLQLFQKAVYLPLLVASILFLVSSVLWFKSWPHFVLVGTPQYGAIVIAIIAAVLVVVAALINILRVLYLRRFGEGHPYAPLDILRGRAHEELGGLNVSRLQPLLAEQEAAPAATTATLERPASTGEEETFAVIR
ncbi:hypothetical protein GOP47_0026523 [Adiantum capillus-veneris]|nr:hypothetical protein GOP47_0026523 [Adiantum capillus-veneris]